MEKPTKAAAILGSPGYMYTHTPRGGMRGISCTSQYESARRRDASPVAVPVAVGVPVHVTPVQVQDGLREEGAIGNDRGKDDVMMRSMGEVMLTTTTGDDKTRTIIIFFIIIP
jgi:hypothetical protein